MKTLGNIAEPSEYPLDQENNLFIAENTDLLNIDLTAQNSSQVSLIFNQHSGKIQVFLKDRNHQIHKIKDDRLPCELNKITNKENFTSFCKNAYAQIIKLNDQELTLKIHQKLKGGMNNNIDLQYSSEIRSLIEKFQNQSLGIQDIDRCLQIIKAINHKELKPICLEIFTVSASNNPDYEISDDVCNFVYELLINDEMLLNKEQGLIATNKSQDLICAILIKYLWHIDKSKNIISPSVWTKLTKTLIDKQCDERIKIPILTQLGTLNKIEEILDDKLLKLIAADNFVVDSLALRLVAGAFIKYYSSEERKLHQEIIHFASRHIHSTDQDLQLLCTGLLHNAIKQQHAIENKTLLRLQDIFFQELSSPEIKRFIQHSFEFLQPSVQNIDNIALSDNSIKFLADADDNQLDFQLILFNKVSNKGFSQNPDKSKAILKILEDNLSGLLPSTKKSPLLDLINKILKNAPHGCCISFESLELLTQIISQNNTSQLDRAKLIEILTESFKKLPSSKINTAAIAQIYKYPDNQDPLISNKLIKLAIEHLKHSPKSIDIKQLIYLVLTARLDCAKNEVMNVLQLIKLTGAVEQNFFKICIETLSLNENLEICALAKSIFKENIFLKPARLEDLMKKQKLISLYDIAQSLFQKNNIVENLNLLSSKTENTDFSNIAFKAISHILTSQIYNQHKDIFFNLIKNILTSQQEIPQYLLKQIVDMSKVEQSDYALNEIRSLIAMNYAENIGDKDELLIKKLPNLLDEFLKNNSNNSKITEFAQAKNLDQLFANLHNAYYQPSLFSAQGLINFSDPIDQWQETQINQWTKAIKDDPALLEQDEWMLEALNVIKQATKITEKYEPRETQILSALLLLDAKDQGRILQISTGEGKSQIVAMFAVIKALEGKNIDIITSSSILAQRDAEEKQSFYKLFDITVSHNDIIYSGSGAKACYQSQVVYGAVSNFQFDYLRHGYLERNTLGDRKDAIAIVDEVDSMLIDEASNIARLSSHTPEMEFFELIYMIIWQHLDVIDQGFFQYKSKLYYQPGGFKVGQFAPGSEEYKQQEELILDTLEIDNRYKHTVKILKECIKESLTNDLENSLKIPAHLKKIAFEQSDKWAESACLARYIYQQNKHYIKIHNDQAKGETIAPVCYSSTGVIHENTSWCNGLHQFLQLKHNLKLTSEDFVTSFISNVRYFKFYGAQIYGMTGTLGAKDAQNLLSETYNIDFGFIPTYKIKQLKKLPAIISFNETTWTKDLLDQVVNTAKNGRAVLVICKTIFDTELLEVILYSQYNYPFFKIKKYTGRQSEMQIVQELVNSGDIILATNVAGRGTDIKVNSSVLKHGGLSVIVGFLPDNLRVEEQALGRTARQGQPGTTQLIISLAELKKEYNFNAKISDKDLANITLLKGVRDRSETQRLENLKNKDLAKISLQDDLFREFCILRKELKAIEDNKIKLSQAEELWSFWLKINIDNIQYEDFDAFKIKILEKFEALKSQIKNNYPSPDFIQNPNYKVLEGNKDLEEWKNDEAKEKYDQAISKSGSYRFIAQYNAAMAIASKGRIESQGHKSEIIKYLVDAKLHIEDHTIPHWQAIYSLVSLSSVGEDSDIIKQINGKISFLQKHLEHIQRNISKLENCPDKHYILIDKKENLNDLFKGDLEVEDYQSAGLTHFFELKYVKYKEKKSWWQTFTVFCASILQIVGGACIAIGSCGTMLQMGWTFISEGIKDFYTAIKSMCTSNFDWTGYWKDKALSYLISFTLIGVSAIQRSYQAAKDATQAAKEAAKNAIGSNAAKTVAKEGVVQATQEVSKQQVKDNFVKELAGCVASSGFNIVFNEFVDSISNDFLEDFYHRSANNIQNKIKSQINNEQARKVLHKVFAADSAGQTHGYSSELRHDLLDNIYEKQSDIIHVASIVGKSILKAQNNSKLKVLAAIWEVAEIGSALHEVDTCADRLCRLIANRIENFQAKHLPEENIQYKQALESDYTEAMDAFAQDIAYCISNYMIHILKGKVIAPISSKIGNAMGEKISDGVKKAVGKIQERIKQKDFTKSLEQKASNDNKLPKDVSGKTAQEKEVDQINSSESKQTKKPASNQGNTQTHNQQRPIIPQAANLQDVAPSAEVRNLNLEIERVQAQIEHVRNEKISSRQQDIAWDNMLGLQTDHPHQEDLRAARLAGFQAKLNSLQSSRDALLAGIGQQTPRGFDFHQAEQAAVIFAATKVEKAFNKWDNFAQNNPQTAEFIRENYDTVISTFKGATIGSRAGIPGAIGGAAAGFGSSMANKAVGSGVNALFAQQIQQGTMYAFDASTQVMLGRYPDMSLSQAQSLAKAILLTTTEFGPEARSFIKDIKVGFKPHTANTDGLDKTNVLFNKIEKFQGLGIEKGLDFKPKVDKTNWKDLITVDSAGNITSIKGTQVHHIVHQSLEGHDLLKAAGVDIECDWNKMFLPTKEGAELWNTNRSYHQGRHDAEVAKMLREKMNKVMETGAQNNYTTIDYHRDLMDIIKAERAELHSGTRALNSVKREWAIELPGQKEKHDKKARLKKQ